MEKRGRGLLGLASVDSTCMGVAAWAGASSQTQPTAPVNPLVLSTYRHIHARASDSGKGGWCDLILYLLVVAGAIVEGGEIPV